MATCLAILSPAKTLIETAPKRKLTLSKPLFLSKQQELMAVCKSLTKPQIKSLMGLSDPLTTLNYDRFQSFDDLPNLPACYSFNGPAHAALDIQSLDPKSHEYAENSIITLSGLYGILRPLDELRPYRLEMGTKLQTSKGKNLYEFWGEDIAVELLKLLSPHIPTNTKGNKKKGKEDINQGFIVNVASEEYWNSVKKHTTTILSEIPIFTIKFPGPSVYAKQARGLFCRFLCEKQITESKELILFEDWCDDLKEDKGYSYKLTSNDEVKLILTFNRVSTESTTKAKKRISKNSEEEEAVPKKKGRGAGK